MTKREKEEQNMLLAKAYKDGFNKARFEFSKDEGFITKEYFKGYDAALDNIKNFMLNVTKDDPEATFKIMGETEIQLFGHNQTRRREEVSIREAFTRYITSVQQNYSLLKRQLGGE